MLRLLQKLAWGEPSTGAKFADLDRREWFYLAPLAVFVFYIGLAPTLTLKVMSPSIETLLKDFSAKTSTVADISKPNLLLAQHPAPAGKEARQ